MIEYLGETRFYCRLCPYVHIVTGKIVESVKLKKKKVASRVCLFAKRCRDVHFEPL